jgi:DTW domain-containing protein
MIPPPALDLLPRPSCPRCGRPERLCWCAHLVSLETRTRVILLQHPAERRVAIGTARMAKLCLPSSELYVGVDWSASKALALALSDPSRPAALLYPGEDSIDIGACPPEGPITLVVVDGTWHQARKLVRANPVLAALPRYTFLPAAPSEYRIRREPRETYVSTLEALAHVLGVLEGDPERFASMRVPFRAMIDAQIACERAEQNHRGRRPRGPRPAKPSAGALLRERAGDLVCVIAEANAWARRADVGAHAYPDELVQWVAHRPSSGETFDAIVAPRNPLGPGTLMQSELTEAELARAETLEAARSRWRAFARDTDVLVTWGSYPIELARDAELALPAARIDLRKLARDETKGRAGTPREYLARCGGHLEEGARRGRGRAGTRLASVAAITDLLSR